MRMKIVKLFVMSGVAGLMSLGTAAVMAGDKGMDHSMADYNKDGMVTEDELVTFVRVQFMTMDKNNDHMVESNEWNDDWFLDQ